MYFLLGVCSLLFSRTSLNVKRKYSSYSFLTFPPFVCVYSEAGSAWVIACENLPPSTCSASSSLFLLLPTSFIFFLSFFFFYPLLPPAAHSLHLPSASLRSANLCPRTAQACECVVTPPCRANR